MMTKPDRMKEVRSNWSVKLRTSPGRTATAVWPEGQLPMKASGAVAAAPGVHLAEHLLYDTVVQLHVP